MPLALPKLKPKFSQPVSLNSYLTRLTIGALGPLLLFSIFMMVLFARQQQADRRRGLENTARSVALAVDQEIKSSIANLEALATSEPLDVGAVSVFNQAVAGRFLKTQDDWKSLTLFNSLGERLASVDKSSGREFVQLSRDSLRQLQKTRLPIISEHPASRRRAPGVTIHMPVVRDGTVIYILSAAIEPWVFTKILAQQRFPKEWVGTLYDSKQLIISRSRNAKDLIGTPVGPLLRKTDVAGGEQVLRGRDSKGTAFAAVSRLQAADWFFALTVPNSELNAILYSSLASVGGGGLLFLASGLAVALLFARRASRAIADLSRAAHDLGRGHSVNFPATSPIAELDGLAHEMERAAQLLREREAERDRVEAELRSQEKDLRRQADLLNLANEAIFACQLDSRIIYWNRGAEQLYGYSQSEAIGASAEELLATEFPHGARDFEARLIDTGEWSGELKQKTKHGRRLDVESRFKLIDDRAGERLILECNRDISQRKKSARCLAVAHQVTLALAESETADVAWGKILEIIGVGLEWEAGRFWRVDKATDVLVRVKTWHGSGREFAVSDGAPALARGMGFPGWVWQREEPVWIGDRVREPGAPQISSPGLEEMRAVFAFPIKMRNEILGVIEFFGSAVRERDNDVIKTVQAIAGEIGQFAERMRAEDALRQSEEDLRDQAQALEQQLLASGRLVAVGELTASMAHEFNNPLGIILGFAQGLLESMDPADADYQHVRIIADEAKRCEKLVQELLEFGRPKNADFILTNVEQIIHKTMNLVQPHAAKNRVETTVQIDPLLPQVYADPQQLQQILLNFSLNAVDAMPKGGLLAVGATRDRDDGIVLTVTDTGIGIDADMLPRIFQPFFTSKKRRGLGLGLPICDRIVKAHGGTIGVESRPGEGTTFRIHLPRIPPAAKETAGTEPAPSAAPPDSWPSAAGH